MAGKNAQQNENMKMNTGRVGRVYVVERNGKPFGLIWQASLAHFKASDIQCHFSSLHANIDQEFPKGTEFCEHKVITLKSQPEKQIQLFQKCTKHSETVTLASYQLAWNIARAKKPDNEGLSLSLCVCVCARVCGCVRKGGGDVHVCRVALCSYTVKQLSPSL